MTETPAVAPATPSDLRDWLRDLKKTSGASFADIARSIGEEERTVKRWMPENGEGVIPRGDSLLRLLDYFGVTLTPAPPSSVSQSLSGELRALRNEIVHNFGGNVTTMTPEERAIIVAIADGVSTAELAARWNVTVSSARKRVSQTLDRVQERARGTERIQDPTDRRLEALEAKVAELPTAEDLGQAVATLQAAIDRLATADTRGAQQEKPARKRGAR